MRIKNLKYSNEFHTIYIIKFILYKEFIKFIEFLDNYLFATTTKQISEKAKTL